jgi:uncharacterized membrane protein YtjA (UPF0391 family)
MRGFMLKAAISFFVMGLLSFLLAVNEAAGVSMRVGKILLVMFLIFSLISFIGGITTGKTKDQIS